MSNNRQEEFHFRSFIAICSLLCQLYGTYTSARNSTFPMQDQFVRKIGSLSSLLREIFLDLFSLPDIARFRLHYRQRIYRFQKEINRAINAITHWQFPYQKSSQAKQQIQSDHQQTRLGLHVKLALSHHLKGRLQSSLYGLICSTLSEEIAPDIDIACLATAFSPVPWEPDSQSACSSSIGY